MKVNEVVLVPVMAVASVVLAAVKFVVAYQHVAFSFVVTVTVKVLPALVEAVVPDVVIADMDGAVLSMYNVVAELAPMLLKWSVQFTVIDQVPTASPVPLIVMTLAVLLATLLLVPTSVAALAMTVQLALFENESVNVKLISVVLSAV